MDRARSFTRTRRWRLPVAAATFLLAIAGHEAAATLNVDASGNLTLEANFRYPPTQADIDRVKVQMQRAKVVLCDATDGQIKLSTVRMTLGDASRQNGDIWLLPQDARSNAGGHINLFLSGVRGDVIAHELGHALLGLGDEYFEPLRSKGCGIGPCFDADVRLDEQFNTIMQQSGSQTCRDPATGKGIADFNAVDWWDWTCLDDSQCGRICTAPACPRDASGNLVNFVCMSPPPLMSELNVADNNDLRRGTGGMCPAPRPGQFLTVNAKFNPTDKDEVPEQPGQPGFNCGNGTINMGEQCDGFNLNGQTCNSLGFSGGSLLCYSNCGFFTTLCGAQPTCGNGILDPGEACDGVVPPGVVCEDFGFRRAALDELSCDSNCGLNFSRCIGQERLFDPTTLETAIATSSWTGQVTAIDSLGRIAEGLALQGQSVHTIYMFIRHLGGSLWAITFGGPDEEYEGGTPGNLRILKTTTLRFLGRDLVEVDLNHDPDEAPPLVIGGVATGQFRAGSDGVRAPEMTIDLRLLGITVENWTAPWNANGPTIFKPGTDITAGLPGEANADQVGSCDDPAHCRKTWNSQTGRFEGTAQTAYRPENEHRGDWDLMQEHLKATQSFNMVLPIGLPEPAVPAVCNQPVTFDIPMGAPNVVAMVIDRSGSMAASVNGPGGGGESRLAFAKAAARGFVDLQNQKGAQVALLSFNQDSVVEQDFAPIDNRTIPPAPTTRVLPTAYKTKIDALTPAGATAIGTALHTARTMVGGVTGSLKAILLLSDLENNTGAEDPTEEASQIRADGVAVFTIPVGSAADKLLMSRIGPGRTFDAPAGDELPTTYLELFARTQGETPVMQRTPSAVEVKIECGDDDAFPCPPGRTRTITPAGCFCLAPGESPPTLPTQETFDIPVEAGAQKLNLMLSARNASVTTWNPRFTLKDPAGTTVLTDTSASIVRDAFYRILQVASPAPGTWRLNITADPGVPPQFTYLLAHLENPGPDCSTEVVPRTPTDGTAAVISAHAYFGVTLGSGVTFTGTVRRPDGSNVPLVFTHSGDPAVGDTASIPASSYVGRGVYDVVVRCEVGSSARAAGGESIWRTPPVSGEQPPAQLPTPAAPDISVVPFRREAHTAFFLDSQQQPPRPPGGDCDHNGIPDSAEPSTDTDADNLPDICDDDDDNDDTPDVTDPDPRNPNVPSCQVGGCPTANAGPDRIVECVANGAAPVVLDGRASTDPNGDPLTYQWTSAVPLTNANTAVASGNFPLGANSASLRVTDGHSNSTDAVNVTVIDSTGPSLTVPTDRTISSCNSPSIGQATATDACGGTVTIVNDAPTKFPLGTTVVTWRAIDRFGNVTIKQQRVTAVLSDSTSCCPAGTNIIMGNSLPNTLTGTNGADCILGLDGNDTIDGKGGNDFISGGGAQDTIVGGTGNDRMYGGEGDDVIRGGDGDDTLFGGTGQDQLFGDAGNDTLNGEDGDDRLTGGIGVDTLNGGQGQDRLFGEAGNDILNGDDGDDTLDGGPDNDTLNGGVNNDTCIGGTGTNVFQSCEIRP